MDVKDSTLLCMQQSNLLALLFVSLWPDQGTEVWRRCTDPQYGATEPPKGTTKLVIIPEVEHLPEFTRVKPSCGAHLGWKGFMSCIMAYLRS